MVITASTIITLCSLITAIIAIFTLIFKVHKWFLKQEKQDEEIRKQKEEMKLVFKCIFACLDGLEQLGCNHSVPATKEALENYLNDMAHQ